jgi:hypothetical protein
MIDFRASCATEKDDYLDVVSVVSDASGKGLNLHIVNRNNTAELVLSKEDSIELAKQILNHYGVTN